MEEADRAAYLAALSPGADIDHSGTPFTRSLLNRLLDALCSPTTPGPQFGLAMFVGATFDGGAHFGGAVFNGTAAFDEAIFNGDVTFLHGAFAPGDSGSGPTFNGAIFNGIAMFHKMIFNGGAHFGLTAFNQSALFTETTFTSMSQFLGATFADDASFRRTTFHDHASFYSTTFNGNATFDGTVFRGDAGFKKATFNSGAEFDGTIFNADAGFAEARFEAAPHLGPLVCGGTVNLDRAVFGGPVTVQMAPRALSCRRTHWRSTAALRLRYAEVDLAGAVLEYPVTLAAEPEPFADQHGGDLPELGLEDRDPGVRVQALSGVDAVHLALTDVDLSDCRFVGTVHLDQLRIEGRTVFSRPPVGWHRRGPVVLRWSQRRTLAEEHHWRAAAANRPAPGHQPSVREWRPGPQGPARPAGPDTIAAIYRQLRKALEDGKNEPGAADFYYGECEMRRHDRTDTTWAERILLTVYWAVSGYGLRASRALAWLAAAMTATVTVMVLWGIPVEAPKPTTVGRQVQAGQTLTLVTDVPDPVNPTGPLDERITTERFEKSLRVLINSVIFRSSGQDLTTAGTYIEMASRLTEPVLLGLAVLATRSRVKR
ncbi:pentapeptide repeat-containing protein [Streptomyces sp. NPDC047043]|uniref:pentapeptide repeat-containing protein n=1 Tax=Streptomyces sp. NPDC047043 TaxID=3154497 RepID=UPI0033CD4673